jgi:hypothetical protein
MITLDGFTPLPETATIPGAAIDAFTAKAFRENDALFEKILQSLMCSPFMPSAALAVGGSNDVDVNSDSFARAFLNVKTITVTTKCTLTERVPLIWVASDRIVLNEELDGSGKGAVAGTTGDFGGSGGGGASVGPACFMPLSGKTTADRILLGGAIGAAGQPVVESWQLSRALLHLAWSVGGAGGADVGGAGGGVVCLCAPIIELRDKGKINVAGQGTTTNKTGGGGGGLVILIARQIINAVEGTTILINGGTAAKSGSGQGGAGKFIKHEFK